MLSRCLPLWACASLAFADAAVAQVTVEWDRNLQISAPHRLRMGSIHANPNGGWYASASRAKLVGPPGQAGIWIDEAPLLLRLDAQGQVTASQDLAAVDVHPDVPQLAVDASGGVVAGLFRRFAGTPASILRLDSAGVTQWSVATSPSLQHLAHVGFAPNGDVLAGGDAITSIAVASWSSSGAPGFVQGSANPFSTLGTASAISANGSIAVASRDYWGAAPLIRVHAPDGSLAWSATGTLGFWVNAIAFTPAGELVAVGYVKTGSPGIGPAHVARWSANGTPLSSYSVPGFEHGQLSAVAVSASGDVAAVGRGVPVFGGPGNGLLLQFDAAGSLRWTRSWSGLSENFDDGFDQVRFRDSGEILAGGYANISPPINPQNADSAPALTCWGRDGVLAWQYLAPWSHGTESCTSIAETSAGSVVFATRTTRWSSSEIPSGGRIISLRPQSVAFCFGDGTSTACPCGNLAALGSGAGCLHSLGQGGLLGVSGVPSVSNDSLVLRGSGMPSMSSALYFQGTTRESGGAGSAFGDGKRCASGAITRLGSRTNSSGASQVPSIGGAPLHVTGAVSAGDMRTYQVWYRNSAAFCTPAGFNLTNGVEITWGS